MSINKKCHARIFYFHFFFQMAHYEKGKFHLNKQHSTSPFFCPQL